MDSFGSVTDAAFTVFSAAPDRVRRVHGVTSFAPKRQPFQLFEALRRADAMLYTGGAPFYDDTIHMGYFATLAATARLFHVPIIVFAVTARPFQQKLSQGLARFICRAASYVGGRESWAVESLSSLAGPKRSVNLLPDPAAMMKPIPRHAAQELLAQEGVDPSKKAVGICLRDFSAGEAFQRHHYNERYGPSDLETYVRLIRQLVETLLRDTDYGVVFFPMHTVAPDDDRVPAQEVAASLENGPGSKRLIVVKRQYGPREMKGLLGLMELVVGIRFHSLVLGSSMGTPVLSIGYAPRKCEAFMSLIGQERYFAGLRELSSDWLISRVFDILHNRGQVVSSLRQAYSRLNRIYEDELTRIMAIISDNAL